MTAPTLIATATAAAVAALERVPAVCPEVSRGRRRVIAQELDAAVVVRPVQAEVTEADMAGLPITWQTKLAVECYVRSGASTDPDTAVDSLVADTYARLLEDPTLGGVILALKPEGIGYEFDFDGQQTACATLVFEVKHRPGAGGATLN